MDWKYHFVAKQWLDQLPTAGSTANGWINCQWLDQLPMAGSTVNGWINCIVRLGSVLQVFV